MAASTYSTECPVAALALTAKTLIDNHNRLDLLALSTRGPKCETIKRLRDDLGDQIFSVGDSASYLLARSGVGALFQIHLIRNLLEILVSPPDHGTAEDEVRRQASAAIDRMLYSIRDEVERITGDCAEDACSAYYMPKEHAPLSAAEAA